MNISESTKNKILKIYYDPVTGYHKNITHYYELLNHEFPKNVIKFVIDNIESNQLINQNKNNENLIKISNIPNSFQIDLTFYNQFKKQNNNYIGLFTAININSRMGYAYPIKSKNKLEMTNIITKFINDADEIKIIESDAGNEFINSDVKKLLDYKNIQLITFNKNYSPNAMSKVERFNKTIRDKLTNYMNANNTNKYIDVIDNIIKNYNNTVHSSTNEKPINANEQKIFINETSEKYEQINNIKKKFNIGDHVRILLDHETFEKGSKNKYSKSVYKISDVDNTKYKVINIEDQKDIKNVLPFQMKKIDLKNLTKKKETRQNNRNKKDEENTEYKKSEKSKRFIKKEGLI